MSKKTVLISASIIILLIGMIGFLGVKLYTANQEPKPNVTTQAKIPNVDPKPKAAIVKNLAPTPMEIKQVQANQQNISSGIDNEDKEIEAILSEIKKGESSTDPNIKK